MHVAPITTGKVKTRTLENHKGAAPLVCKLAEDAPPAKKTEKLNYMHANPVKLRLVNHPKDRPWSSWSFYRNGEAGLIQIDEME
jgi:hypothetical protein